MEKTEKPISLWRRLLFIIGVLAMLIGLSILAFLTGRKLWRDYKRQELMRTHVVVEIPDLRVKAPVLEGTEQSVLSQGAGHFPGTGEVGSGNYCIAGHSSTIYKEYFNQLKHAETGMQLWLYDAAKNRYDYTITDHFIVEPEETWILDDFGDDRVTLVTCTDDGSQRLIVVAEQSGEAPTDAPADAG